jgi:hypothetical protein
MNDRNVSYYRPMGATNRKTTESGLIRRSTKGSAEESGRAVRRSLQNTNRFLRLERETSSTGSAQLSRFYLNMERDSIFQNIVFK